MDKYPEIESDKKTGKEKFHLNGMQLPLDVLSFWQWFASDLVGNALRGILAEYIVASAVDKVDGNRIEWDAYDIETNEGIKVEVKSGAYLQSWSQDNLSPIKFDIHPTKDWDEKNNIYTSDFIRPSDVYVFCVLEHKIQKTIDPLNMDQWRFYVIATDELDKEVGTQKTISLGRLNKLKPIISRYHELYASIKKAANK